MRHVHVCPRCNAVQACTGNPGGRSDCTPPWAPLICEHCAYQ